jgi:hypothetical protein
MANILLGMIMYSHSRSEDMLVHHRDVATPRDPVTARMGKHFYRYFPRILNSSFLLAHGAEAAMLARKDLPATDRGNPFWKYAALQGLGLDCSYFRQAPRFGSSNWSILSNTMAWLANTWARVNINMYNHDILGAQHIRRQICY